MTSDANFSLRYTNCLCSFSVCAPIVDDDDVHLCIRCAIWRIKNSNPCNVLLCDRIASKNANEIFIHRRTTMMPNEHMLIFRWDTFFTLSLSSLLSFGVATRVDDVAVATATAAAAVYLYFFVRVHLNSSCFCQSGLSRQMVCAIVVAVPCICAASGISRR